MLISGEPTADSMIKQKLPPKIEVAEGKPFKLEVKVDGRPLPDVQWFKDGVPLKPNEHIKFGIKPDGTVTLEIKEAQPGDTGKYELKATSPNGQSSATSSDVVVGSKNIDSNI